MIDTIKGYMEIKDGDTISQSLILFSKFNKKGTHYTVTSNIDNFKFTVRYDSLTDKPVKLFFNGSLTKFYFGDNLRQLDWDEMKVAIKKLSNKIGLNLKNANLTRIDFGMNITVNYPVHEYISCLNEFPRLEYMRFKNSVTFFTKGKSRSFVFYEKIDEIKNNGTSYSIPSHLRDSNILRYEIRLQRNLNRRFRLKSNMRVKDLFKERVQEKLVDQWIRGYQKVNKMSLGTDPLFLLQNHNGLYKYLSYHGLEKVGYNRILNTISDLNFDIKSVSSKRSKMKGYIRDLLQEVDNNELDRNLVTELDEKIKSIKDLII